MQAYLFDKRTKKIHLSEVPLPEPGDKQVLIRIHATSINASDYRSMKMGIVPKHRIFGSDLSGEIIKLGRNARKFAITDEVVADLSGCGMGGFAEYASADESVLARKPDAVPHPIAASLPMASVTGLQALRNKGKITKGQKVLIYGAAGGVGSFAIQLAKHLETEVTGVCSEANMDLITRLGADVAIDYRQHKLPDLKEKYDLVLAVQGNNPILGLHSILKKNGRLVVIGGELSQLFRAMLLATFYSIGSRKTAVLAAKPNAEDLEYILDLVAQEALVPNIENLADFSELPGLLEYASRGHSRGKQVIKIL